MRTTRTTPLLKTALHSALFAAAGLYFAAGSQAAPAAGSVQHTKALAETHYDAEIKRCRTLKGQAEDVCKAEAKFQRVTTVSSAEARDKASPKAAHKAREEIADARYDVDKERCRLQEGQAREVCLKDAKAAHVTALTNAQAAFKSGKAWEEAAEDQAEARRDAAEARCDTLDGSMKAACRNQARAAGNPVPAGLPPTAAGTAAPVVPVAPAPAASAAPFTSGAPR